MKRPGLLPDRVWIPVAITGSVLILIMLHIEGLGIGGLMATFAVFVLWWIGAHLGVRGHAAPAQPESPSRRNHMTSLSAGGRLTLDHFHARLLANLEYGWGRFQQDYLHTLSALHSVDRSLEKAQDIARSTGLLAANAMVNAAQCGEIGRGFVSVSRDMIGISEQSETDLDQLRSRLGLYRTELGHHQALIEYPLEYWLVSRAGLPTAELINLHAETRQLQQLLGQMSDRYRCTGTADVRWLQLGDAVRRLLAELTNTLYQLELHLQDVLSDMRLLQLSPVPRQQIVEIKDRMQVAGGRDGVAQKFIL